MFIVSYVPFLHDDDMERLVEMCSLEIYLLRNVNLNDKVVIIADKTTHSERDGPTVTNVVQWRSCILLLLSRDIGKFTSRLWALERTLGIPRNVEDLETVEFADVLGAIADHLTRCAHVCFTGTENQAEQHDHGTIDEVLGDQDMQEGGDVLDEADREADLLEQIPLLGT